MFLSVAQILLVAGDVRRRDKGRKSSEGKPAATKSSERERLATVSVWQQDQQISTK